MTPHHPLFTLHYIAFLPCGHPNKHHLCQCLLPTFISPIVHEGNSTSSFCKEMFDQVFQFLNQQNTLKYCSKPSSLTLPQPPPITWDSNNIAISLMCNIFPSQPLICSSPSQPWIVFGQGSKLRTGLRHMPL